MNILEHFESISDAVKKQELIQKVYVMLQKVFKSMQVVLSGDTRTNISRFIHIYKSFDK